MRARWIEPAPRAAVLVVFVEVVSQAVSTVIGPLGGQAGSAAVHPFATAGWHGAFGRSRAGSPPPTRPGRSRCGPTPTSHRRRPGAPTPTGDDADQSRHTLHSQGPPLVVKQV